MKPQIVPVGAVIAGILGLALIVGSFLRPDVVPFQSVLAFVGGVLVPALKPADKEPVPQVLP